MWVVSLILAILVDSEVLKLLMVLMCVFQMTKDSPRYGNIPCIPRKWKAEAGGLSARPV